MWTDSLKHFHFWCQKTLPLVYDDSLSYYEVLAKLTKHLNELTTLVNEIGDELERYEGVTDDRLDTLETWRTEVDTWRAQIDDWKEDVNTWIEQTDTWKQSTENHLTAHDNWISYATGLINDTIMPFIEDMTTRVGVIEDDIDTLQSDVTSLDGRLDTAEDDIDNLESSMSTAEGDIDDIQDDVTDLQNRMSTAETNLVGLNKALRIISITVSYDQTAQIFKAFCTTLGDDNFIKSNLTSAQIPGSTFGYRVRFLMKMSDASQYNYSNIYLYDDYGNAIQYEGSDAYLTISHSTDGVFLNGIDGTHLYLLDTQWPDALPFSLSGTNSGQLPRPTNPSTDNGKVVAYNDTLKNYELITPPSPTSSHNYSTTPQVIGKWIDNSDVYEVVITGSGATAQPGTSAQMTQLTVPINFTPSKVYECFGSFTFTNTGHTIFVNCTYADYTSNNLYFNYTGKVYGDYNANNQFTYEIVIKYKT